MSSQQLQMRPAQAAMPVLPQLRRLLQYTCAPSDELAIRTNIVGPNQISKSPQVRVFATHLCLLLKSRELPISLQPLLQPHLAPSLDGASPALEGGLHSDLVHPRSASENAEVGIQAVVNTMFAPSEYRARPSGTTTLSTTAVNGTKTQSEQQHQSFRLPNI